MKDKDFIFTSVPFTHNDYFCRLVHNLVELIKVSPNPEVAACLADCIANVAFVLNLNYEKSSEFRK